MPAVCDSEEEDTFRRVMGCMAAGIACANCAGLGLGTDISGCTGLGVNGAGMGVDGWKAGAFAFRPLVKVASGGLLLPMDGEGGTEMGGVAIGRSLGAKAEACGGIFKLARGEIDFSVRLEMEGFLVMCFLGLAICTWEE